MKTKDLDEQQKARRRVAKLRASLRMDEQPPQGWITAAQFAVHIGKSHRWAWQHINEWVGKKMCEVKKYKVVTLLSYKYLPHYKFHPDVAEAYGLPKAPKAKQR